MISDRDPRREIQQIQRELEGIGAEGKIKIVFVIVPDSGSTYSEIKKAAEIKSRTGVLTQCIKGGTVFRKRGDGSTISNILLKVNAKLNGTNHKLITSPIMSSSKCMFIGADVTHPSPDQTRIPRYSTLNEFHKEFGINVVFLLQCCWRCCFT